MKASSRKFSVGERVWLFDSNYRILVDGRKRFPPTFAEHYRERIVVDIRRRGYSFATTSDPACIEKVGFEIAEKRYRSDREKIDEVWAKEHRSTIVSVVEYRCPPEMLRRVAEVIGYETEGKT